MMVLLNLNKMWMATESGVKDMMALTEHDLAALYDQTIGPVWRLACCLTGSRPQAEDLVARAYGAALRAAPAGPAETSLAQVLACVQEAARTLGVPPLRPVA